MMALIPDTFLNSLLLFVSVGVLYPEILSAQKTPTTLIRNATVHTATGTVLTKASVGIDAQGRIDAVGTQVSESGYRQVIDAKGGHIYPGLIAAATSAGLYDIEAVRASVDTRETGAYNPHARALIAFNTDSDILPTLLTNGVLLAQSTPEGGVISGTSSIMALHGWNWEDAAYRADDGVHLHWPNRAEPRGWWADPQPSAPNERYRQQIEERTRYFEEARAYCNSNTGQSKNLAFEALRLVFSGQRNLYIHVNEARGILEAIDWANALNIQPVIIGGRDSWKIASELAARKVPILLHQVTSLPATPDEDIDQPYRTPAILYQAGVLFGLTMEGGWQQRNLPFQAGKAVAYGLDPEAALAAVSLQVARILGIADRTGSVEVGKEANLLLVKGDLLDMRSSVVERAWLRGIEIDLKADKQWQLYQKYLNKYGLPK